MRKEAKTRRKSKVKIKERSKKSSVKSRKISDKRRKDNNKMKKRKNSKNKSKTPFLFFLLSLIVTIIIISSIIIILKPPKPAHITLLTVSPAINQTTNSSYEVGGTADLYLEIRPGEGKIYLDSYPLTKIDTQSTTRYAQKVACDFAKSDCSKYDFYYTIRADAPLIGGPSASAAIAILTVSVLKGDDIRPDAVITGTINSGGIIGPVGGVPEKKAAAASNGFHYLLISDFSPSLSEVIGQNQTTNRIINQTTNQSANLTTNQTIKKISGENNKGKNSKNNSERSDNDTINTIDSNASIIVKRVSTLREAYSFMTNKDYVKESAIVIPSKDYEEIMTIIEDALCNRSHYLEERLRKYHPELLEGFTPSNKTGVIDPYSKASLCYSDLLKLRGLDYERKSDDELMKIAENLKERISVFRSNINKRTIRRISELESTLIIKERLEEAESTLQELFKNENSLNTSEKANIVAFVEERLNAANEWSRFFHMRSPTISVDHEQLVKACSEALSEAEERVTYLGTYLPQEYLTTIMKELGVAEDSYDKEDYTYCVFEASKVKAETNMMLAGVATSEEEVQNYINKSLEMAGLVINEETKKNHFPIAGYSYYKYAETLKERSPYSAMLFAHYAMELSNLEIYFPEKKGFFKKSYELLRTYYYTNPHIIIATLFLITTTIIAMMIAFNKGREECKA